MIPQSKTETELKKLLALYYPEARVIKIHGEKYQESGLMDFIALTWTENYWLEAKNDWINDEPSKLQKWNVGNIAQFNFITGFIVGDEYKKRWDDEIPIILSTLFKKSIEKK